MAAAEERYAEDQALDDQEREMEEGLLAEEAEESGFGAEETEERGSEAPELSVEDLQRRVEQLNGWAGSERHRNNELAAQNRELQEYSQRLAERQERLIAKLAEAAGVNPKDIDPDAEEPEPDKEERPAEWLFHKMTERLSGFEKRLDEAETKKDQQEAVRGMVTQIQGYHQADIESFSQDHGDYQEAEDWLRGHMLQSKAEELRDLNPMATDDQIAAAADQYVTNVALGLQVQHARAGTSLADWVYQRAQRLGYQPGSRVDPKRTPGPADTLRKRRTRAGTPVSAAAAGSGPRLSKLTAESVGSMTDKEFDEFLGDDEAFDRMAMEALGIEA